MTNRPTRPGGWRARSGDGGKIALAAAGALVLLGVVFSVALLRTPTSLVSLAWLVLAMLGFALGGLAAALAYGFHTLTYVLGRNTLMIRWLGQEEAIAYGSIDAVYSGTRLGQATGPRLPNLRGYRVGLGWTKGAGTVHFYTTSDRAEDVTVIATEQAVYALTPADPAAFRRALIARIEASEETARPTAGPPFWLAAQAIFSKLPVAALGLSATLWLAMMGIILSRYSGLPELLGLYVNAAGQVEPTAAKIELFSLPAVGFAMLALNVVIGVVLARAEPVLARLIWTATPLVEAMLLISVLRVLS